MRIIVDIKYGRLQHGKNGYQHCVRFYYDDGSRTNWIRLKRNGKPFFVSGPKIRKKLNEPQEIQNLIELEVLNLIRTPDDNGGFAPVQPVTKTVAAVMAEFFEHLRKTHKTDNKRNTKRFLARFGAKPLTALKYPAILDFAIDMQEEGLAADTVRLYLAPGSEMISWLKRKRMWHGDNPFFGIYKEIEKGFGPPSDVPYKITDDEYDALFRVAEAPQYRAAKQFMSLARYTGLRISEILNLDINRLDVTNQIWSIRVTKTKGREFYRKIYVPTCLIAFVINEGGIYLTGLRKQFEMVREEAGVNVQLKTFRKDFARRMELAGAPENAIQAHQGRGRNNVLYQHYIKDPMQAVRLAHRHIDSMFSGPDSPGLKIVK